MVDSQGFRWLHLSDIHVGMSEQDRVWPRSATVLLDDLETAHKKTGGFDVVVFSGDLAQRGSPAEFDGFQVILDRVLDRLAQLGPKPPVVTVPGNHDLARPNGLDPIALALARYWNIPELQQGLWSDDQYLDFLNRTFSGYTAWRSKAIADGVHLPPQREGLLPGDASYLLDAPAGRLGVVALNSTWLQLGAGDYEGNLHVDARQLLAIAGPSPDDWTRSNDANLLVTHQPSSWFRKTSPATWDNDLDPAGRFDLHLFGHMHEPETRATQHGGGPSRRRVQAASLFGLESYGDGHRRIQGYSINRLEIDGTGRKLTSWPRRLIEVTGGRWKLAPDNSQDIDEESGGLSMSYEVERRAGASTSSISDVSVPSRPRLANLAPSAFDLGALQHPLPKATAHLKVRRVEQQASVRHLTDGRVIWLSADWGMGEDGFLASLCPQIGVARNQVFRLDFAAFTNDDGFYDELRTRFGVTFQQMCAAIANGGPCILILDDVEAGAVVAETERAVETLVQPILDYAPEAKVVIQTRRKPRFVTFPLIELSALDEPDVATYARESELGGERYARPNVVSSLYRHTDGVPSRLDDALRDLEIVSVSDLMVANPDLGDASAVTSSAPPALVAAVTELERSDDRSDERAFNLLLALATLPKGEQLNRLTRFLGPHPFHPAHARTLLERSLIDTATVTTLDGMPDDSTRKALVVSRPVRDYVRSIMSDDVVRSFDTKALEMYFGGDWMTGGIATSQTGRRVKDALCDGYEIQNACTLILRAGRRALDEGNPVEIGAIIRLASAFVEVLMTGDHFRSAASLCEDTIQMLSGETKYAREINVLRYELARGYRMSERVPEAVSAFQGLDHSMLSKGQRQSAELGLALALKREGDVIGSVAAAERAIALDRRSINAVQAKTILANQIVDADERRIELTRLLAVARKAKSITVTNNILIELARAEKDDAAAATILSEVAQAPRGKADYYNGVRAIVDLASRPRSGQPLPQADRSRLVDAYHFLWNERLFTIFDRCHEALWSDFEKTGETENLLNLFRHSSFIWRLNGREELEAEYLAKLVAMVREVLAIEAVLATRDGSYFMVRVSVVLKEIDFRPKP